MHAGCPAMCLIALAWRAAPSHRVVLVANRDELHARPSAPLARWADAPILGGRDLAAGGTWLAADARGRFGAITNFRGAPAPPDGPTRGELIPRFLRGTAAPADFLEGLVAEAHRYAGFSLLLGDANEVAYLCNHDPASPRVLAPGVHALSNGLLDAAWPKTEVARANLAGRLQQPLGDARSLLDLLRSRAEAPDAALPATGTDLATERRLSAAFIVDREYGTRATTALLIDPDGRVEMAECRYDPAGSVIGDPVLVTDRAAGR